MGRINDTVATVNSAIRTVLVLVILGVVGTTGYFIFDRVQGGDRELDQTRQELLSVKTQLGNAEMAIVELEADIAEKNRQIERMELAMQLLTTDHRLARLDVMEQRTDEDTGEMHTTVRFTELSPDGDPIGPPREFTIRGDVVYLDNWVVKFDDKYVEQADLLRGTSLVLIRRLFGEYQQPAEGFVIDRVGSTPQVYKRGGQPSEFEQEIWDDFWTFANDNERAKEKGIRAAHGDAASMKLEPGRSYRVELRASGGVSIIPEGNRQPAADAS